MKVDTNTARRITVSLSPSPPSSYIAIKIMSMLSTRNNLMFGLIPLLYTRFFFPPFYSQRSSIHDQHSCSFITHNLLLPADYTSPADCTLDNMRMRYLGTYAPGPPTTTLLRISSKLLLQAR